MRSIAVAMTLLAVPTAANADLVPRHGGDTHFPVSVHVRSDPMQQAIDEDLRDARRAIDRRRRNGEITRQQARRLRREAAIIERMSDRYGHDGLDEGERRELEQRANTLEVRAEVPRGPVSAGG